MNKIKRCPNGSRRNKKTGLCEQKTISPKTNVKNDKKTISPKTNVKNLLKGEKKLDVQMVVGEIKKQVYVNKKLYLQKPM